jgi:DNA repair exonuclease SbcCD ATPase subunit
VSDKLSFDRRTDEGRAVTIESQLKRGRTKLELYDFLYGLNYLQPHYTLKLGQKPLQLLSPGERGLLLLVFYLLVDRDTAPLIIDQPEENLDNQTIFELLVPCIKAAKLRRQVIVVTHNPNLAVVCDAEQIIVAKMDTVDSRVTYVGGSIENPTVNAEIVKILEGTMPAFTNRDGKYLRQ